jgi:hypothetical protein
MQVMPLGNVGFNFLSWLIIESLWDTIVVGIPTFGVFV